MSVITVTKENFNEVVKEGKILLDFWAPWCGPCRMLGPVLETLAKEDNLTVGKVNVDEEDELAAAFSISSIPALFLLQDGKIVHKTIGYQPIDELRKFINEI